MTEIYISCIIKDSLVVIEDIILILNRIQDSYKYILLKNECIFNTKTAYKINDLYYVANNIKQKRKIDDNIIIISDKTIIKPDNSIAQTHLSISLGMGVVNWEINRIRFYLMKDLIRLSIQFSTKVHLIHDNESCFFYKIPNYSNYTMCDECKNKLLVKGLDQSKINAYEKCINNLIEQEYFSITQSHKSKEIIANCDDEEFISDLSAVIVMDIVSYSLLTDTQQKKMIIKLQKIIKKNEYMSKILDKCVFLPTGDGCIISIFGNICQKSVYLVTSLQKEIKQENLLVRYGINFGSVFKYKDINNNINIAGNGVNLAARAMDKGDGNHILANRSVFDYLGNTDKWHKEVFHNIGYADIKHSERIELFNIYSEEENIGNIKLPKTMERI